MLNIDRSGNITVNRGDTFQVPLFIDINDKLLYSTRFPLKDGDKVFFHITAANLPFEKPLLGKAFTIEDVNENNDILIRFEHEDTVWLHPGTYYYEIKLIRETEEEDSDSDDEEVKIRNYITIAPRRKFIILN